MRILGVDWGGSRIGIAVAEQFATEGESQTVYSPRKPLASTGTLKKDAENIVDIAVMENVSHIVVGVPEFENDRNGARITRMVIQHCRDLGWKVSEVNESMTTKESHEQLKEIGLSAAQRKTRIDGESACRILERYILETV